MKANELRIGNCLFVPGVHREVIVSAIFKTHYVCEDYNGIRFEESLRINYQPIPLKEEWLLKFGFEKINNDVFRIVQNDNFKSPFSIAFDNINNLFKIAFQGYWYHCKYVHQLQNIYFALTGEELTYTQL